MSLLTRIPPSMVRLPDNAPLTDWQFLGEGGQGEVWRIVVDGRPYAAKVYRHDTSTDEQRTIIERLVRDPVHSRSFLWPEALIEITGGGRRFGYLMPLRTPNFRSFNEVVGMAVPIGFTAALKAGINLADAFLALHARGLAYRDISLGNVFIDPDTGDIAICDTDNVGIDGAEIGNILGTSGFMAPEIERGEARPSAATDRHSLAVLLFLLFVRHHPLEGRRTLEVRCMDLPARRGLYGTHPLYILDPRDTSNHPHPREQPNPGTFREIYPSVLWKAFERAFTDGLTRPQDRVTESAWLSALRATRDLLVKCPCGARRFVEPGASRACWSCRAAPAAPLFLKLKGGLLGSACIAVAPAKPLHPERLGISNWTRSEPPAVFERNPNDPSVIGLRNHTGDTWSTTSPSGASPVPTGRATRCAPGIAIQFGSVTGTFTEG